MSEKLSWELREPLEVFPFTASSIIPNRFCFKALQTSFESPFLFEHFKRQRSLADVDGEGSELLQKKKRRLRLVLITSRLSKPYAVPPTFIVSRGSSKIAIWARQKALGRRNSLRKATIINRTRRYSLEQERSGHAPPLEAPNLLLYDYSSTPVFAAPCGEVDERPNQPPDPPPHRQRLPLPPSPLGLTNYDAIDDEDVFSDDEDGDGGALIYTDWNVLQPTEPLTRDHDALYAFEGVILREEILGTAEEHVDELMEERQRQKQVAFVDFGY